ncbi:unnamed protein product [Rotaria sp. Silwood1]|nr:unnamed protein product [Rotaria sp. Silwood1]CAF0944125.1 unnamed protein product [Rotaria sp. Silwood1]CAF3359902.1 unnamed protein product [Rotaria sp. Silwood1]CAF3383394.1 unnamed protein product [Rotaria sp. Silwood1]CAF4532474.1 unnamed protein product [Rotaria sp. Silwood1]
MMVLFSADDEEQTYRNSHSSQKSVQATLSTRQGVETGNKKTIKLVNSLKKSLVTRYDTPPTHSFIRRKLAILSFKVKNPHSIEVGDTYIDQTIDQKIRFLKQNDKQTNVPHTDDVYMECLIRSSFNENEALKMLHHNRPNLVQPTVQPVSNQSAKVSIDNSVQRLKQHWNLLNEYKNENNLAQQLLRENDQWRNVQHLIPAIRQLRLKNNGTSTDDDSLSKMYRLLYSELSKVIGRQVPVKIETIASVLCELDMEPIENLDIAAIKNILCSSNDSEFSDNFRTNAIALLSMACPLCFTSFPRSQMETMFLCDHKCCSACVKNYYRATISIIQDYKSLNKLTCFMEQHEITNDTEMNFFTYLEAKLNQWFRDEPNILQMYHEKIFYAKRGKEIKKCGNSQCVSCFSIDDNDNIDCVRCPHCQFAQCRQCCRKWHPDHTSMSCDAYAEWLIDNDPDDPNVQILKYLSKTGIACPNPNCQSIYEYRAGGCEHFTCTKCHTEFCRMCSTLFYSPKKDPKCPQANCTLKATIHAHCTPNCFRETRIGEITAITKLLKDHKINVTEELHNNPVSTDNICPVEDCTNPTSSIADNRFCETCYKQFLSSFVWRYELEPWEIYEDNNLRQMLIKASVTIPENTTRQKLLELSRQNLNRLLGKPKKLTKQKFS